MKNEEFFKLKGKNYKTEARFTTNFGELQSFEINIHTWGSCLCMGYSSSCSREGSKSWGRRSRTLKLGHDFLGFNSL